MWPDLGSNPGRRGGKPATNRLSYVTTIQNTYLYCICLSSWEVFAPISIYSSSSRASDSVMLDEHDTQLDDNIDDNDVLVTVY
jgi:hypothetical protein